jgi:O-methyltransferase
VPSNLSAVPAQTTARGDLPPAVQPTTTLGSVEALLKARLTGPGTLWDMAPRRADLREPRRYADGVRLQRRLKGEGYTMTSSRRGRTLHRLAATVAADGVPGALVDCGVWNGGSTVLLSRGAPGREAWAFDSFEGLPEPGQLDGAASFDHVGDCLGSEERLREAFRLYADPARLNVRKGWFEDTFPAAAEEIDSVAVLHCDGDWYDSVMLTLETFYAKVSPGGFVVIDDYGHWVGAREATDEFRHRLGITAPLRRVDYTGHYWRKP